MNRSFGIELEIAGINRQTALTSLSAVGIAVHDESYNHTTRPTGNWWATVACAADLKSSARCCMANRGSRKP